MHYDVSGGSIRKVPPVSSITTSASDDVRADRTLSPCSETIA